MIFRRKSSKEEAKKLEESHLKNLMVLAKADGHLSEIELHLLEAIAHRIGLTKEDISTIEQQLDKIEFVLPEKYDDRLEQFEDLLTLMAIDGNIDPEEEEICRKFGKHYELMEATIEKMIDKHR
ncbi:tellurite resistance TerB family protein [Fulvivirga lutea]|uniref:TerB family tellurite resistance protein n=1 Tax=Fulvivirga lutea TaxID=2810512 RepID=A0A974WJ77_9BACT|nr:TerB family tellurite resistance protein [Fulvivirga lutea]QSE96333.1 TerB family tellurite resistance protein [Fulvivirga lutea]